MSSPENSAHDPWQVLGLSRAQADDDAVRQRYLELVKQFPPEKAPDRFEQIRDAYQALRRQRAGTDGLQLDVDAGAPLVSLLPPRSAARAFVGPPLWRKVLQG